MAMIPKSKTQATGIQTETERMHSLRTKVERSLDDLMRTRQHLEKLVPLEGNSELSSFLLLGPADLRTELQRHKELTSKIQRGINTTQKQKGFQPGTMQTGSSYEFLKKILSD